MKKIIILLLITAVSYTLFAMDFVNKNDRYQIDLEKLNSYARIEIVTHRVKDGEEKDDLWTGVPLKTVLLDLGIENYSRIKAIAHDNYMVRYEAADITDEDPIIALTRNKKILSEDKIRLVAPSRRDMFWIQNLGSIETEIPETMNHPEIFYISKALLNSLQLVTNPQPFEEVEGYFLRDLISQVFPTLSGEFLLMGSDGVRHLLAYEKYLSEAVIILEDGTFYMKSPQMPGGMWIQKLSYIQQDDTAIIFTESVDNLSLLAQQLEWKDLPEGFKAKSKDEEILIKIKTPLNTESLKDLMRIEW